MNELPELWELVELFEMEPIYIYREEKGMSWFYNTVNFNIKRGCETLDITISPAYGDVSIGLLVGARKIMEVNLEHVEGMKIEKLHNKEMLHIFFKEEDETQKCFIVTKPQIFVYCNKKHY